MAYPYASDQDEILSRLRKIEGQIRGIQRMVSEDASRLDVLTQISAVLSGMEKVAIRVVREHVRGCVSDAIHSKSGGDEKVDDAVRVIERFLQA